MDNSLATLNDDSRLQRLIGNARNGSAADLSLLFETARPMLSQLVQNPMNDAHRRQIPVAELIQETWLRAFEGFPDFRGQSAKEFREWLQQLLCSRLSDGNRRPLPAGLEPAGQAELIDSQLSTSATVATRDEAQFILQLLQQLPAEAQNLMRLRYIDNLSFEEISNRIGAPLTTVWRQYHELVITFHQQLEKRTQTRI